MKPTRNESAWWTELRTPAGNLITGRTLVGSLVSSPYVQPFLIGLGLTQTEMFLLQSIELALGILTRYKIGVLTDRYGYLAAIRWGGTLYLLGMFGYSLSSNLWELALAELVQASGAFLFMAGNEQLLAKNTRERLIDYQVLQIGISAFCGFFALGIAWIFVGPLGFGPRVTLLLDVLIGIVGFVLVVRIQWPHADIVRQTTERGTLKERWRIVSECFDGKTLWLVTLYTAPLLNMYCLLWLQAKYCFAAGIGLAWFSWIAVGLLAMNCLVTLWLRHKLKDNPDMPRRPADKRLASLEWRLLVLCLPVVTAAMATESRLALPFFVLTAASYVISTFTRVALQQRYNAFSDHRAMLAGVTATIASIVYVIVSLSIGVVVDHYGLRIGLLTVTVVCGVPACLALVRSLHWGTLDEL